MKKYLHFILIISLVLSLCGCDAVFDTQMSILGAYGTADQEQEQEQIAEKTSMSVLYYEDMDTNPVTTACYANSELLKLVYCPLIRTDDTFKPYCVLAQSYTQDGLTITVKLRSDILFSNGEPVTASDVVKSFDVAKKNVSSPYNRQVSFMSRYYAQDDSTFVCVLKEQVAEGAALLDIPVMQNGESGIGCGPYVFSEQNGENVLVINEKYFNRANVPVIYLLETKNDENITSLFSAGELDLVLDAQSNSLSLTSLRDYSIISYPSNNLIYIGINYTNEALADAAVRRALAYVIDRDRLASQSLVNLADATAYPFNPNWYRMSDIAVSEPDGQNSAALLSDKVFSMAIPADSDIKRTVADSIVESLKNAGATLNVTEIAAAEFEAAIKSGAYDFYLCETAVSRTMDPTFLYGTGGSMNYSGYSDVGLDAAFSSYISGEITLSQYLETFSAHMPIIPVVFRKNVIYCDNSIVGFSSQSPWNSFGDFITVTLK